MGYCRGKHIKLTYKGVKGEKREPGSKHHIMFDGEAMEFENTLILESMPGKVEYLFDYEQYFKDFGILKY